MAKTHIAQKHLGKTRMDKTQLLQTLDNRPIALVGLMGIGKTTVGRRLAKRLSRGFYDSDEEIERASGRTVAGYFRDHGEPAFRDGERRVIERLLSEAAQDTPIVLATGGGAFINESTHDILKENALTIWLRGDFETIMKRVSKKDTRPLLQVADPRGRMRELMTEREPIYAKAHITVDVATGPHGRTVERVIRAITAYLREDQNKAGVTDAPIGKPRA